MNVFERLDELGKQVERRFLGVVAHYKQGEGFLHLLCRGTGSASVVWNAERAEYAWYGGGAHGKLLGATAAEGAEVAGRDLNLRPAPHRRRGPGSPARGIGAAAPDRRAPGLQARAQGPGSMEEPMAARNREVDALLHELGELLDPGGVKRQVEQVYTLAVVLMVVKGQAPEELTELAVLLRRAAALAEELAKVGA